MASYKETFEKALEYFGGDELAAKVWVEKYALKIGSGDDLNYLECSPDDMHKRLAKEFFRIEGKYKADNKKDFSEYGQERSDLSEADIYNLFKDFKYLVPQGSVMANLGDNQQISSLSNCVVIPELYDSYGGIFYADQQLAQLYKRRCGVGLDISSLRPINEGVKNSAGTTSGAISFMERFSNTTREVAQHGRRGALMITMDVRHPEIMSFIKAKSDLTKVTGANISVKLTNDFMRAVRDDKSFELQWPVNSGIPRVTKQIKARDVWDAIISLAHQTAEPGVLFWDRQHLYSTSSVYPGYENLSTNPCSEIAMQGGDSCRLMAINLFSFVDKPFTSEASFDYSKLYEIAYEGMRLMDDLVDLEVEHIERILEKVGSDSEPDYIKDVEKRTWELLLKNGKEGRRTGLGFTGLADALAALGMKYDSDEALLKIDAIMRIKLNGELDSTIDMAIERGQFVGYDPKIEKTSDFVSKMLFLEFPELHTKMMKFGRRNISFSTVAPTGTLSLLTQTSSGIEPVYMLAYKRRKKTGEAEGAVKDEMGDSWEEFEVVHQKLALWEKANPGLNRENSSYSGCTAQEIDWKKRIAIQKIVQKYTTHSISSTINLPSDVSKELVSEIYYKAWESGLKGITVYRDGSRDGVLVSNENTIPQKLTKRPEIISSEVVRFKNGNENWMAVIGLVNEKPYEIFTGKIDKDFNLPDWVTKGWTIKVNGTKGKRYDFQYKESSGETVTLEGLSRAFNKEYWNYAKLISGVIRLGMPLEKVVKLVSGLNLYDETINTWKSGVARALKHFVNDGVLVPESQCPSCDQENTLQYQEGCVKCVNCGFTECS